jgi:hypothetical protein
VGKEQARVKQQLLKQRAEMEGFTTASEYFQFLSDKHQRFLSSDAAEARRWGYGVVPVASCSTFSAGLFVLVPGDLRLPVWRAYCAACGVQLPDRILVHPRGGLVEVKAASVLDGFGGFGHSTPHTCSGVFGRSVA